MAWLYLGALVLTAWAALRLGRGIGIREERGRLARWVEINTPPERAPGQRGMRLKRIRLDRK